MIPFAVLFWVTLAVVFGQADLRNELGAFSVRACPIFSIGAMGLAALVRYKPPNAQRAAAFAVAGLGLASVVYYFAYHFQLSL